MDREQLNLLLFRARKQRSDAGLDELVQRRGSSLRFGPVQVEVHSQGRLV